MTGSELNSLALHAAPNMKTGFLVIRRRIEPSGSRKERTMEEWVCPSVKVARSHLGGETHVMPLKVALEFISLARVSEDGLLPSASSKIGTKLILMRV